MQIVRGWLAGGKKAHEAAANRMCCIRLKRCINWHGSSTDFFMSNTLKSLRALSDATRLRIVALLEKDELSVNELQEVTRMGQSRISTHLGLLLDSELVQSRREGKRTFYKLSPHANGPGGEFVQLAIRGARELPEQGDDQVN